MIPFILMIFCDWKIKINEFYPKFNFFLYFKDEQLQQATKLTARERRFIRFASTEFDNQLYMTPQDFLDSVVEQDPRRKLIFFYYTKKNHKCSNAINSFKHLRHKLSSRSWFIRGNYSGFFSEKYLTK